MIVFRQEQLGFIQRTVLNAIVFMAASGFFPQWVYVKSPWAAVLAAVVLGLLNMLVKPVLLLISLPITFVTLGLFYLVINGLMLELTAAVMGKALYFNGFVAAFLVALIVSGVNLVVTDFLVNQKINK